MTTARHDGTNSVIVWRIVDLRLISATNLENKIAIKIIKPYCVLVENVTKTTMDITREFIRALSQDLEIAVSPVMK